MPLQGLGTRRFSIRMNEASAFVPLPPLAAHTIGLTTFIHIHPQDWVGQVPIETDMSLTLHRTRVSLAIRQRMQDAIEQARKRPIQIGSHPQVTRHVRFHARLLRQ